MARLGFVGPAAITSGASALPMRKFFAENFHVKYLVMSCDPERVFMSGNTGIGEILAVMERKASG